MNEDIMIAKYVYDAARLEAICADRMIVPEPWDEREGDFKNQFVEVVHRYMELDELPTPEAAHDSWMKAYEDMGWKYGEVRDTEKRTHPDMLPFSELSIDERYKDEIFLFIVESARKVFASWADEANE